MPIPADTYLTLSQLNRLYQTLALNILGYASAVTAWNAYLLNPVGTAPPNPYYYVRVEWPSGGAPAWGISEDVCFIGVTAIDGGPITQQRQLTYQQYADSSGVESSGFTLVNSVMFTFYGPNSFDNARLTQDRIFRQENHDTLAQSNVYLIPQNIFPRRVPELFQGQWWDRSDLTLNFNELIVRNEERSYIAEADITVNTDNNTTTTVIT